MKHFKAHYETIILLTRGWIRCTSHLSPLKIRSTSHLSRMHIAGTSHNCIQWDRRLQACMPTVAHQTILLGTQGKTALSATCSMPVITLEAGTCTIPSLCFCIYFEHMRRRNAGLAPTPQSKRVSTKNDGITWDWSSWTYSTSKIYKLLWQQM